MTLSAKQGKTWLCPRCSHRNEWRGTSRKCQGCGKMTRRKKRVPKHAVVLRDMSYEECERISQKIHGGDLGACGYCKRPKPEGRRHDRDHDHVTGRFRGLACFHCNRERLRHHTRGTMVAGVAYFDRAEDYYRAMGTGQSADLD